MTYYDVLNEAKITKAKTINGTLPEDIRKAMSTKMKNMGMKDDEIERNLSDEDNYDTMSKSALGSSDERFVENIDKEKLQAIIESKNIVEEYKLYLNLEIDKINKREFININNINKDNKKQLNSNTTGIDNIIKATYDTLIDMGIDKSRIKRYIVDTFYEVSDDPKVIKKLLQLRINYNNKIISLLQKMLRLNYKVLGISQEEANHYINNLNDKDSKVSNLNIKKVKQLVFKNRHKFVFKDKIDLRPLGFGVCFHTSRYTGLEDFTTLERMLQLIMRYDVIIMGHGSNVDANTVDKISNIEQDRDRITSNKIKNQDINKDIINKNYAQKYDKLHDEYKDTIKKAKYEWSVQPIRTDKGTFSNMDELVRSLIKQGFKSIYILSCNPGHYELADDIKKTKGVRIHMGNNSILAESTIEEIDIDPFCLYENYNEDSFVNTELELDFTEQKLHELALEYNIDYNNHEYLQESYTFVLEHQDAINEGLLHDAWEYLKKLVKKIIAALIYLFKNAIAMVKAIFNKIKSLFTKQSDPNLEWESNKVSFIAIEGAQLKESEVKNYNQLKTIVLKSCASISKEINKVQNKQLQITKQTDSYIEKKCKESLSECMSVIFGDYIQI